MIQSNGITDGMSYPKVHRNAGYKKSKVAHVEILSEFLHKSQLEASEAVTSKTNYKSVPKGYQDKTKKLKRKRLSTNIYTELTGTKTVNRLGNTACGDVNGAAKNPICP